MENVKELSTAQLKSFKASLEKELSARRTSQVEEKMHDNLQRFVGKCYRRVRKGEYTLPTLDYIKIISNQSSNEYRVQAIGFPKNPKITARARSFLKMQECDTLFKKWDLFSFDTTDIFISDLEEGKHIWEEITTEEYKKKVEEHLKKLEEIVC